MIGYWCFLLVEILGIHLALPEGEMTSDVSTLALSEGTYVTLIIINVFILAGILMFKYGRSGNFSWIILFGFLFRVFLMFWGQYCSDIFALPNSGADEYTYFYNAMSAMVNSTEFTGYALLFSWQAKAFGLSMIYGKYINVVFSISAIIILRKSLIEMNISQRTQDKTLFIACFIPNYAILSALLLRESLIILLVSIILYMMVRWWYNYKAVNLMVAFAAAVFAAWLHSGMIIIVFALACIVVASRRTAHGHEFKIFSFKTLILGAAVIAVGLWLVLNVDMGLTSYFRDADSIEDIVSIADAYEEGGSAYNANIVDNDSTAAFIINTPSRMFYFLLSPLPWNWRSTNDVIAFVFSALFYAYVLFIAIRTSTYKNVDKQQLSALIFISILALMMFGWGVSNSGTALRHRDKFIMIYLAMYALSSDIKYKIKNEEANRRRQRLQERYDFD